MENFERDLKSIAFPNYEKFIEAYSSCSDLVKKITQVINNLAPYKIVRVKNQSNEWFDGELAEQITNRDKLLKKFKKANFASTCWYIKKPKTVQRLIKKKRKTFFSKKLEETKVNPKNLEKTFKNLVFLKQRLLHRIFA